MNNDEKQRLIEEVKKTLEKHEFKQLASWGEGVSEVWECSRPGSSIYAFTICVTRMGIAVVGDIDGLIFNVGSNYGMPFLAGNDVSYYIHSKLEPACKVTELHQDRFQEYVAGLIANYIRREANLDHLQQIGLELPGWVLDHDEPANLQHVADFVNLSRERLDVMHPDYDWFHSCHNQIDDAFGATTAEEAYSLDIEGIDFDWADAPDFMVPKETLMFRLYLVNEAAKRIMQLKEGEAEARAVGAFA